MSVFDELKRRNVFRVGLAYIVLGWVVIQVTDIVAPALQLPDWTLRLVIWIGVIGLPFALFFAWAFEITPDGIQLEANVDRDQSITPHTARKLDIVTIALLLVAVGMLAADRLVPREMATAVAVDAEAIPPVAATGEVPIVAVLPFKATGSDDGGFLAVGLHDDLLTRLARLAAFKVISRTSMMEYADTTKNMREIGEELGANYILEGGVQSRGERVRINAQLIHAPVDEHLWAETYDRQLTAENLFDVQADLAAAIAGEMQISLGAADREVLNEIPTRDLTAYNAYLRGLEIRERTSFTVQNLAASAEAFTQATQLDPEFAQAWAQLSINRSRQFQISQDATFSTAAQAAQVRAAALQPLLPEAELARVVYLYRVQKKFTEALSALEALADRAELDARALMLETWLLRRHGRYEDAYRVAQAAHRLDPRSVDVHEGLISNAVFARDCESAGNHARAALTLYPDLGTIRTEVAHYELQCTGDRVRAGELMKGIDFRVEEPWTRLNALLAAEQARDWPRLLELLNTPGESASRIDRATDRIWSSVALQHLDRTKDAMASLREAQALLDGLPDDRREGRDYAFARFRLHAVLGDSSETLFWIEEHRRRLKEKRKGDVSDLAVFELVYAEALTQIGRFDEALVTLDNMFQLPGGRSFIFVDGNPEFDPLRELPGYAALRVRYGED